MQRDELLRNPGYWTSELQLQLYRQIEEFMEEKQMNRAQLAEYLGCSKGYVTQLLNGDFNHKLSKYVELVLAIGKVPVVSLVDADEYILEQSRAYTFVTDSLAAFSAAPFSNDEIIAA